MSSKKVAVTGIGMIDANGNNYSNCWRGLIDGKNPYSNTKQIWEEEMFGLFPTSFRCGNGVLENEPGWPRALSYGMVACRDAIGDAGVKGTNVGVIFSSLLGGNDLSHGMIKNDKVRPKQALNCLRDSVASVISQQYGFRGMNTSIQAACATGIVSIDMAMKYLDEYDFMVVGGTDAGYNGIDIPMFKSWKALGLQAKPFDVDRRGFVMGEGSGCLILESAQNAISRGAHIYAWLYPAGQSSDAYNRVAPQGRGAIAAMEKAMENGPTPDVVNTHGTGTLIGDSVEYTAIDKVLGGQIPLYSVKGKIAHTMAAAGILETIYSIASMQAGIIPGTYGCKNPEYDINVDVVEHDTNVTLNNSFGFGGKCASMIIEKNVINNTN